MLRTKTTLAFLAAAALGSTAFAVNLGNIRVTGIDADNDTIDDYYALDTGTAYVTDPDHPNWFDDSGVVGEWIGPFVDGTTTAPNPATFKYTITFDLFGASSDFLQAFAIKGKWASDNSSTVFLRELDNTEIASANSNGDVGLGQESFKTLSDFEFNSGFEAKAYKLEFEVLNRVGSGGNPTSLLVAEISAVPEPATVLGSLFGLGMIGYVGFRRRKAAAAQS